MVAINGKAIILQKNGLGQLRVRADFDTPDVLGSTKTMSRQMENKLDVALVNNLANEFEEIFTQLEAGIPPE